jgi:hypothetical protein
MATTDSTTDPRTMVLASALTKRLDATWSVGTNQGGLDTGSIANGTYHVWLIQRSDTGVVDALFSTSATAPTMPASYDRRRRIGSIMRVSAAIRGFVQAGDLVLWKDNTTADVNVTNPGTSAVLRTMGVPSGLQLEALVRTRLDAASASVAYSIYLSHPGVNDDAVVGITLSSGLVSNQSGYGRVLAAETRVLTNTSSQIRSRLGASDTNIALSMSAYGYVDTRGRTA